MINAFTSNWFIFFPLAFSFFISLRLAQGSGDLGQSSFGANVVRILIAVLFVFSGLAVGLRASIFGFVWLILLSFFGGLLYWKNRRQERSALLLAALRASTPALQLALAESFWSENRGWLRRRAMSLRHDILSGVGWATTLERHKIAHSVYECLAVRLVSKYGPSSQFTARSSPESSRRQLEGELLTPLQMEAEVERLLGRLFIFSWIVIVFPLIAMIMMFIVPTFKQIFEEFGISLPPVMAFVVLVADATSQFGSLIALILTPLLIAMAGLVVLLWFFPKALQRYPFRWLCSDYYRNAGFAALSHTVERESNLALACGAASRLLDIEDISRQYQQAADLLSSGLKPQDAFLRSNILSQKELTAFQIGFDHRDPRWCLQQLANWKIARMFERYSMLVQFAIVVLTLIMAAVIGSVAVGVIQVLSTMVTSLSS